MKQCTKCKEDKILQEFNKNKSRKDGYNNICRICSNERSRKYYLENNNKHRKVISERNNKNRNISRDYVLEILKKSKCKDCGNNDIRVLEFDHLKNKFKNVSSLISAGYSVEIIQNEINKCDVICANCHRIRTINRSFKNYRKMHL